MEMADPMGERDRGQCAQRGVRFSCVLACCGAARTRPYLIKNPVVNGPARRAKIPANGYLSMNAARIAAPAYRERERVNCSKAPGRIVRWPELHPDAAPCLLIGCRVDRACCAFWWESEVYNGSSSSPWRSRFGVAMSPSSISSSSTGRRRLLRFSVGLFRKLALFASSIHLFPFRRLNRRLPCVPIRGNRMISIKTAFGQHSNAGHSNFPAFFAAFSPRGPHTEQE